MSGRRGIDPRLALAVATSKLLARGIRLTGRGGGTTLPGRVAGRVDPRMLDKLSARLPCGTVVVAGTNGKTTSTRMLAEMLAAAGRNVVHNRAGSNLVPGVSAAFAQRMPLFGTGQAEIGVVESDEAAFPDVVRRSQPRVVVLLNLFRDQLDRYGELETIAESWRGALAGLDADATLVVNADDPNLAALAEQTPARVVTFGLEEGLYRLPDLPHAADAAVCRRCESPLTYDALYISHLGDYHCPSCGYRRPGLQVVARGIELDGVDGLRMKVRDSRPGHAAQEFDIDVAAPGLYNAYNALAMIAAARVLGVGVPEIKSTLRGFEAAYGRMERVEFHERELVLMLAKNPVSFNELLRLITAAPLVSPLLIGINDRDADGRDVSWLWDADFEVLAGPAHTGRVFAAGVRGADLAVRLKYAGVNPERLDASTAGLTAADALDWLAAGTRGGERVYMLLTYTAMHDFRRVLVEHGLVEPFWEQ